MSWLTLKQCLGISGLFVIGEGSVYAGGITSSVVDAMKCICQFCSIDIADN